MFRDSTVEEQHDKRMQTMKMGSNPATIFFQKLEIKAKLAGRRDDTGRRGTMVVVVQQGVPWSYTSIISSIGVGILQDYDEWKERILVMYEERERDRAYNDSHGIGRRDDKKPGGHKQIAAPPSNSKTPTGTDKGHDAQGRWHTVAQKTFGGQGQPMDVDAREEKKQKQRAKGHCFKCNEWGHLSKDCTTKKIMVRVVEATTKEPLTESTKVEEVKE